MAPPGATSPATEDMAGSQSYYFPTSESILSHPDIDQTSRPANLNFAVPYIDVDSSEGKLVISKLKEYFCMPENTSNDKLRNFVALVGSGLEHNVQRICMRNHNPSNVRDSMTGEYITYAHPIYVPRLESYRKASNDILDQFNSLGWYTYPESPYDISDFYNFKDVVKTNNEDSVPESQIRTFRAVPKVGPFNIPAAYACHLPKNRSPLSIVTVVVEENDTRTTIEASRFNKFIPVELVSDLVGEDSLMSFVSDNETGCSESTSSSWSTVACISSNDTSLTFASFYSMEAEANVQFQDNFIPSEQVLSLKTFDSPNGLVSYHSLDGQMLLRRIQGYLERPGGEEAYATSRWIDNNRCIMKRIRLHDTCVALPASLQKLIVEGRVDESLAQFEARTDLTNAISALDWDEIDDEPVFWSGALA